MCLCAFIFIAQTYLFSLFSLDRTQFAPGDATNAALYDISNMLGGPWLKFAVAVPGAALSSVACALATQGATSRLIYGMARDGKLPRALAYVNPVRKVPERALLLVAAVTLVLGIGMADRLELITSMVSFGALVGFLLVHLSVPMHFIWRNKSRDWLRHLVSPAIGFVIIAYVLWNAEANAKIAGLCWLTMGVAVLIWFRFTGRSAALPVE
jgi:amino acid transporter